MALPRRSSNRTTLEISSPTSLSDFGRSDTSNRFSTRSFSARPYASRRISPTLARTPHRREIEAFFDVNQEILQDPEKLEAAAKGGAMLLVPTLPWADTGE